jgi:phosphatidylglycerophosphatase A
VINFIVNALASGFYLSYLPGLILRHRSLTGAGLVGSLWGVAALPLLPQNPWREACVLLGAIACAIAVSDAAEYILGKTDDQRIVIDEFVGYWTTIAFLPRSGWILAIGFVLFRLLDVTKIFWIRRAGEFPGGWGIVADDVAAGLVGNILLRAVLLVHPF